MGVVFDYGEQRVTDYRWGWWTTKLIPTTLCLLPFRSAPSRAITRLGQQQDSVQIEHVSDLYGIHPAIHEKCYELYKNKTYAEAVEKSFKVVRDRLRDLTTHETGQNAFGKGKLYMRGASAPNVDRDFNEAVKFLTMAIDNFRNEKSHTSDAKIEDPIRAYQYLMLSSLAMSLLEDTEIRP